ncbi:MAG: LytR/AlgR family response regulator transcription factor, partial [Gemmatimonadota bacterium]
VRAFEVHALDYVTKPFGERRLREAVERAREQIRLGRAVTLAGGLEALRRREEVDAAGDRTSPTDAALTDTRRAGRRADDGRARRLTARRGGRRHVIDPAEIDWIEATGDYARLHVGDDGFLVRRTLKELARTLDPDRFARIHRSVIVNLSRVREHHPISHGDHAVILGDGTRLRASRTYRKEFLRRLRGGDG